MNVVGTLDNVIDTVVVIIPFVLLLGIGILIATGDVRLGTNDVVEVIGAFVGIVVVIVVIVGASAGAGTTAAGFAVDGIDDVAGTGTDVEVGGVTQPHNVGIVLPVTIMEH